MCVTKGSLSHSIPRRHEPTQKHQRLRGGATLYTLTPSPSGYVYRNHVFDFRGPRHDPGGDLTIDGSGSIYGGTVDGQIFKLTPASSGYTLRFIAGAGAIQGPLLVDASGSVYAAVITKQQGHARGYVMRFSLSGGTYRPRLLRSFDGGYPTGPLSADAAGALYGFAFDSGHPYGFAYRLSISNDKVDYHIFYTFSGLRADSFPIGTLLIDAGGMMYGETGSESDQTSGRLFELTPAAGGGYVKTTLHNFPSALEVPTGRIVAGSDGSIVGSVAQHQAKSYFPTSLEIFAVSS